MDQGTDKLPYRVPLMEEIEAMPANGYSVVSTFSGCGGSCLGFRMAGFQTLWASEFVESAEEVYKLNHPGIYVDHRDIRDVKPEEILKAMGKEKGDVDVLEGSPPCASFSMAGRREHTWGEIKQYSETKQRVDDLFFEFARILKGLQPRVFVGENVSGMVRGKAKGYFKSILAALKDCGYNVRAKVLDAQWLGVPQSRARLFFIGVREDLELEPVFPKPLGFRYTVRDALPWIATVSTVAYGKKPKEGRHEFRDAGTVPAPTVKQTIGSDTEWSSEALVEEDASIVGCAIEEEWERLRLGESSDRYFNLRKLDPDQPSSTVCQAGGNKGTATVTMPYEKRKFTIAELKRICAFPDDFVLTGSYSQQWERLGRAVPPIMMWHIARVIRDELLFKLDGREAWEHDPPSLPR